MTASLFQRVGNFWTGQTTSGHNGLVLLDECIRHVAKHRDWDALARFVARAGADRPKIGAIIHAAFGDQLKYKTDKSHPAGGKFTMNWEGEFNLKGSNSYAVVSSAIEGKKSFRCQELQKALREQRGKPAPVAKELDKVAKAAMTYILKQAKDNALTTGQIIVAMENMLKAAKAEGKAMPKTQPKA